MTTFAQLGLSDPLVRALDKMKITEPFPVQAATIPDVLAGKDVSGKAPTGSGKTLAFGLPLLARTGKAKPGRPTALVLAPTRELAEQIKNELTGPAKAVKRYVFAIYGGVGYGPQRQALRRGVDVLVATPGRLEDLLQQGDVHLDAARIVVIDEADRMADMGFLPAVKRIVDQTARDRQTLLFSATLDGDIATLSRTYQHDPIRHDAAGVENEEVDARHHFWLVDHHDRVHQTAEIVARTGRAIVFTRTRRGADRLARNLSKEGVVSVAMHGGLSQNQRNRAMRSFASYSSQALVATDVAARGIHIDAVESVIHFDPPADQKDYVHRSGRTARAGSTGIVVSLITHQQKRDAGRLKQQLRLDGPIAPPRPDELKSGGSRIGEPSGNEDRVPVVERSNGTAKERSNGTAKERSNGTAKVNGRRERTGNRSDSIYVGNLPWSHDSRELEELFMPFGKVHASTVITDRRTGRSKGFGFVDMPQQAARRAIDGLHGRSVGGRDLTVRFAKPSRYATQETVPAAD
jgi:superfamily II DNA/RNA helicase